MSTSNSVSRAFNPVGNDQRSVPGKETQPAAEGREQAGEELLNSSARVVDVYDDNALDVFEQHPASKRTVPLQQIHGLPNMDTILKQDQAEPMGDDVITLQFCNGSEIKASVRTIAASGLLRRELYEKKFIFRKDNGLCLFLDVNPKAFSYLYDMMQTGQVPMLWSRADGWDHNMYFCIRMVAQKLQMPVTVITYLSNRQYESAVDVKIYCASLRTDRPNHIGTAELIAQARSDPDLILGFNGNGQPASLVKKVYAFHPEKLAIPGYQLLKHFFQA